MKTSPDDIKLRTNSSQFTTAFINLMNLLSQAFGTVSADEDTVKACLSEILTDVQICFEPVHTGEVSISESDDRVFETMIDKPVLWKYAKYLEQTLQQHSWQLNMIVIRPHCLLSSKRLWTGTALT